LNIEIYRELFSRKQNLKEITLNKKVKAFVERSLTERFDKEKDFEFQLFGISML
jgi:hypothetical protein